MEPMTVRPEVWALAADRQGIWLVSGNDAWRPDLPVAADNDVHADVELLLHQHNALDKVVLLHSTSWRQDSPSMVVTYVAVLRHSGYVRQDWPGAEPVSADLPKVVGKPLVHAATDPPTPRYVDVLHHAMRHLAHLLRTDDSVADAFDKHWRGHLAAFEPALAVMYRCDKAA